MIFPASESAQEASTEKSARELSPPAQNFLSMKHAVVFAFAGALVAIVLLTVVEGMFRAELGASRKLVQQANGTTQHIEALLQRLDYTANRELEFATNLDRANTQFTQRFSDQSTKITNGLEEVQQAAHSLVFEAENARLSIRQIHDAVVQKLGEVQTNLQRELQETRTSLTAVEEQLALARGDIQLLKTTVSKLSQSPTDSR